MKGVRQRQIPYVWNLKNKANQQQPKTKLTGTENRTVVATAEEEWGLGKIGEGDQEVQTSNYKISKSWDVVA